MKSIYKKLFFCVGITFILIGAIVLIDPVVSDVALASDTGAVITTGSYQIEMDV